MLPAFEGHPVAFENPVTFKIRAALPAGGAWDVPIEVNVAGADTATFYMEYIRGIAHGAVDMQMFSSPYQVDRVLPLQTWYCQAIKADGVLAAENDVHSRIQREYVTYASTAPGGAETFMYGPVAITGIERMYIRCREAGQNLGLPGTCEIVAILQKGG
jgi:hypothetical protein